MKDVFFKTLMLKGESGAHVSSFEKVSTVGNVDTYVITFDDGTTEEFTVTNGNGIESIEKTGTSGLIDTYTITYEDGDTDTFEITNGSNGAPGYEVPAGTIVYYDDDDTPQGYEPSFNPNGAAIETLQDEQAFTRLHDPNSTQVSISGAFASIENWIASNYIANKWIFARINPTDNIGYFGSSAFSILACLSSSSYGVAMLLSDKSGKPVIYGQLVGGSWTWYKPTLTEIE